MLLVGNVGHVHEACTQRSTQGWMTATRCGLFQETAQTPGRDEAAAATKNSEQHTQCHLRTPSFVGFQPQPASSSPTATCRYTQPHPAPGTWGRVSFGHGVPFHLDTTAGDGSKACFVLDGTVRIGPVG